MEDEENINKRKLKKYVLISVVLCVLVVPLTSFVRHDFSDFLTLYKEQWILFILCGGILSIYSLR